MPTYEYSCEKCEKVFEVVKSIKLYQELDPCPDCGNMGVRKVSCNISFVGTKIEDAEYNPGLGCITKSKRHRDEIAKSKGLTEIGNENINKIQDKFDKDRAEKIKRRWDEA